MGQGNWVIIVPEGNRSQPRRYRMEQNRQGHTGVQWPLANAHRAGLPSPFADAPDRARLIEATDCPSRSLAISQMRAPGSSG
jgi:hypothetical protein